MRLPVYALSHLNRFNYQIHLVVFCRQNEWCTQHCKLDSDVTRNVRNMRAYVIFLLLNAMQNLFHLSVRAQAVPAMSSCECMYDKWHCGRARVCWQELLAIHICHDMQSLLHVQKHVNMTYSVRWRIGCEYIEIINANSQQLFFSAFIGCSNALYCFSVSTFMQTVALKKVFDVLAWSEKCRTFT